MLELTKKILHSVSFDQKLFQKELNKALKWITDAEEVRRFQEWCIVEKIFSAKNIHDLGRRDC